MSTKAPTTDYTLPTTLQHHHTSQADTSTQKSWRNRFHSTSSNSAPTNPNTTSPNPTERPIASVANDSLVGRESTTHAGSRTARVPKWWKVRLLRGMVNDVKRRAPFYWSDWVDAWDYRVVPATVYMYFANILPALAFSLDMFEKTNMSFGVNEVLLASVLGGVFFSLFAAQPLVIVGVTGPITVFNYTVYDIMAPTGVNYFAFMCLIGLWSLIMHTVLAITNSSNALRYVTRFSCDIFGFYVAFIYLQKGIQVLTRQGEEGFYLSIVIALLVTVVGYLCGLVGDSPFFQHYVRVFIKDYGTVLTIIFFTGFVHVGKMARVELEVLPTSKAFLPTTERGWFVHFWDVRVKDVFIAIPFAILLTVLFWFDHNVSSLIAQGTEFPLRKPAGFHWDIFLLGLTTGLSGLLGIPFPNGLIPQAPFHTASLCVTKVITDTDSTDSSTDPNSSSSKDHKTKTITTHVVEQRLSNLLQGLLTLATMTTPLLSVLNLIPQSVLAGLFFVMGIQALQSNPITHTITYLLTDASLTPPSHPLNAIKRKGAIWAFLAVQLTAFGITFAITQTVAAVGFPVVILALIPLRSGKGWWGLGRWFSEEELAVLDGRAASEFTLESVGGSYGGVGGGEGRRGSGNGGRTDEGVLVGGGGNETYNSSEEEAAERGEGVGVRNRHARVDEGGSIEFQELQSTPSVRKEGSGSMRRRSFGRQS